jgi:alkylation response protein AidB-like acyl-CoA dehydrogenase
VAVSGHFLAAVVKCRARLEKIGAFGLTEPCHGTDVVVLETSARRDGDSYVLNGHKRWIGNAMMRNPARCCGARLATSTVSVAGRSAAQVAWRPVNR